MRKQFCDAIIKRVQSEKDIVFLTGDLGFMALEPIRDLLGERFVNAGVAEQNMVSTAAALAKQGFETWVYSIAPFIYARSFEQIRNDIAFHELPVKLVGNGGGFGYGVMGPTHHAVEDYGVLLTLPNVTIFTPVFDEDLASVVKMVGDLKTPAYLRLGRGERPAAYNIPAYAPLRQLIHGSGMVAIVVGTLAGAYLSRSHDLPEENRPNLWAISELPIRNEIIPESLLDQIASGPGLCIAEEHVKHGGFGSDFSLYLLERNIRPKRFHHLFVHTQITKRYGSQQFLRKNSGLDSEQFLAKVNNSDEKD